MASTKSGIDFADLARRRYERATPEARARIDAHEARQAIVEATRAAIEGNFEGFAPPPRFGRGPVPRVVERTWTKPLSMTIEGEAGAEVIRFHGAVTGHESYRLDEAFCALLTDPAENRARPRFYLCAGTPGRYDGCWVDPADVAGYLRDRRPDLFPDAGPAPAP